MIGNGPPVDTDQRAAAGSPPAPSLHSVARLGIGAAISWGLLTSLAVIVEVGVLEGMVCCLASLALLAVALPILMRRADLAEPIWLVTLVVAIGVTGKAYFVCFGPEDRVRFLMLDKQPADLLAAALTICVALICFSIGYLQGDLRISIPGLSKLLGGGWDQRKLFAIVAVLLFMGISSFVLFALRLDVSIDSLSDLSSKRWTPRSDGRFRSSLGYLRWGALQIELAFDLVLVWWAARDRKLMSYATAIVLLLAILASAFPIFVSSRQSFVFLIFKTVLVWILLRGQPKLRHLAMLAALTILAISLMLALRRGASDLESLGQFLAPAEIIEVTVGGRHFLDLTKTAHVLDAVPEVVDHRYGSTLVTWLVTPIPRSWWPEKPPIGVGIELGPPIFRTPERTGVPPGIVGELYLNFGYSGIFVGMLIFGYLLRAFHTTFAQCLPAESAVALYAASLPHLAVGLVSSSVSGSMARWLQEIVPLTLAVWWLGAQRGGTDRTMPADQT